MKQENHLLIVAGTGRNVGKTEFVCRLISKISTTHEIYALKVSAVYPGEDIYHGNHSEELSDYNLFEEILTDTEKDTSRMLRAGAQKVFYLRSDDTGIDKGFENFRKHIPKNAVIVCESNSLWQYVKPGLLILLTSSDGDIKQRARDLLKHADMVVTSDLKSGFPELNRVDFSDTQKWTLNKQPKR